MNKKIQSFTLIEILVVIVVIGILSSFILVGMSSMSSNASVAKTKVWAESLRNAGLTSIVSEYKFDGSTAAGSAAQAADLVDSWGSNNGNVTAAPPTVVATSSCAIGKCVSFNGTTQFVTITDATTLDFGTQMSAFIWVKGSSQDDKGVFGQYDETNNLRSWAIATSGASATKMKVHLASAGATVAKTYTSSDTVFDNKWHYIGFTYTVNTLKIFIDGLDVSSTATKSPDTAMTTLATSTALASIGSYVNSTAAAKLFTGSLDNAIMYNTALTTSEIQEQYFAGLNDLLSKGQITQAEYLQRVSVK